MVQTKYIRHHSVPGPTKPIQGRVPRSSAHSGLLDYEAPTCKAEHAILNTTDRRRREGRRMQPAALSKSGAWDGAIGWPLVALAPAVLCIDQWTIVIERDGCCGGERVAAAGHWEVGSCDFPAPWSWSVPWSWFFTVLASVHEFSTLPCPPNRSKRATSCTFFY
jgi:hypothetical protein